MADFGLPIIESDYENVWDYIKAVQTSLARWQDGTTDTNIPVESKRWSDSNKRFEEWNGSGWVPLVPLDANTANAYQIRVAMANACSGNAASADLANNSHNLGGTPAVQYVKTDDGRLGNSRQCNNNFDNAGTARSNMNVYSKNEIDTNMAPLASPALSGTPSATTANVTDNSARIATTAFVKNSLPLGDFISLSGLLNAGWSVPSGSPLRYMPVYKDGVVIGNYYQVHVTSAPGSTNAVVMTIPSGAGRLPNGYNMGNGSLVIMGEGDGRIMLPGGIKDSGINYNCGFDMLVWV